MAFGRRVAKTIKSKGTNNFTTVEEAILWLVCYKSDFSGGRCESDMSVLFTIYQLNKLWKKLAVALLVVKNEVGNTHKEKHGY